MDKLNLKDDDLSTVTGGYKTFDESQLHGGSVIRGFNITDQEDVTYYLLKGSIGNGVYACTMWHVRNGQVTYGNIETTVSLNNSEMIYSIEDNPPAFVHE